MIEVLCVCVYVYLMEIEGGTVEPTAVFSCQNEVGEERRPVALSDEPA